MKLFDPRHRERLRPAGWVLLMALLLAIIYFGSLRLKSVQDQLQVVNANQKQLVLQIDNLQTKQGPRGAAGADGTNGLNGKNGSQGPGPTAEQIVAATNAALPSLVEQWFNQHPVTAVKGDRGDTPVLSIDAQCRLLVSYPGTDAPVIQAVLPGCTQP